MSPVLAALAVVLAVATVRELSATSAFAEVRRRVRRGLPQSARTDRFSRDLRLAERIRRAGLEGRLTVRSMLIAKAAGALSGALFGFGFAGALPVRLAPLGVAAFGVAGFLAPDAFVERHARRRRARIVAALPDALDLMATGLAAGRAPTALFAELAASGPRPFAVELGAVLADVESGVSFARAVAGLRRRVPGPEMAALAAALERSRRHGSPLADQLREQASAHRDAARRQINERASRAAPKIQLVVALILVPSVLLIIAAALIAHSDTLFAGLR